jgi:hypothetical protein
MVMPEIQILDEQVLIVKLAVLLRLISAQLQITK